MASVTNMRDAILNQLNMVITENNANSKLQNKFQDDIIKFLKTKFEDDTEEVKLFSPKNTLKEN